MNGMRRLGEAIAAEKIDVFVDFSEGTFFVKIPIDEGEKIPDLIAGLKKDGKNNVIVSKKAREAAPSLSGIADLSVGSGSTSTESEFGPYKTSPGLLAGRKVTRAEWVNANKTAVELELENGRVFQFYSRSPIIFDHA